MKEEAYNFLKEHQGYLKCSPSVIQERLGKLNVMVSLEDIVEVRTMVKTENQPLRLTNDVPDNMKVSKMWVTPGGKTGYSYKAIEEIEEQANNDILESLQRIVEEGVTPFGVKASKSSKHFPGKTDDSQGIDYLTSSRDFSEVCDDYFER